ncbi:hypothetical protein GJ496_001383 [Pomphorhynchus laevis]|nr:hypothetical protein GJ496_001383 [Pomphorhynchus laevis]
MTENKLIKNIKSSKVKIPFHTKLANAIVGVGDKQTIELKIPPGLTVANATVLYKQNEQFAEIKTTPLTELPTQNVDAAIKIINRSKNKEFNEADPNVMISDGKIGQNVTNVQKYKENHSDEIVKRGSPNHIEQQKPVVNGLHTNPVAPMHNPLQYPTPSHDIIYPTSFPNHYHNVRIISPWYFPFNFVPVAPMANPVYYLSPNQKVMYPTCNHDNTTDFRRVDQGHRQIYPRSQFGRYLPHKIKYNPLQHQTQLSFNDLVQNQQHLKNYHNNMGNQINRNKNSLACSNKQYHDPSTIRNGNFYQYPHGLQNSHHLQNPQSSYNPQNTRRPQNINRLNNPHNSSQFQQHQMTQS